MISERTCSAKDCLVVVADDMGKSVSVNQAIAEAHDNGILTSVSIMAGGKAFDGAVQTVLARERLSAGLHLTLCDGKAVLPHETIPDITDMDGNFIKNPFTAGLHYTKPGLLAQIEAETAAQFDRLEGAGIRLHHVDGHHHLHMHPLIFEVLCRQASQRGVKWIRIPREPLSVVVAFRCPSRGMLPFIEWAVFQILGIHNCRKARKFGLHSAGRVFGLARSGNIDEHFLLGMFPHGTSSFTEIYAHPDKETAAGRIELAALVSPRVRDIISALQISHVSYKDLREKHETIRRCGENIHSDIYCDHKRCSG